MRFDAVATFLLALCMTFAQPLHCSMLAGLLEAEGGCVAAMLFSEDSHGTDAKWAPMPTEGFFMNLGSCPKLLQSL